MSRGHTKMTTSALDAANQGYISSLFNAVQNIGEETGLNLKINQDGEGLFCLSVDESPLSTFQIQVTKVRGALATARIQTGNLVSRVPQREIPDFLKGHLTLKGVMPTETLDM